MSDSVTMNLKVGDVCEIVADADGVFPTLVGRECTIVGPLEMRSCWTPRSVDPWSATLTFLIAVQGESIRLCARPCELRLKKPPTVSWEDCIWKPTEVTA